MRHLLPLLSLFTIHYSTFAAESGVTIHHFPLSTARYIGSPAITQLPNGHLLATHDYFDNGDYKTNPGQTCIHTSTDNGSTWTQTSTLNGISYANLFTHNSTLYLIGVDKYDGRPTIAASTDNATTWTTPNRLTDIVHSGAPTPIVTHDGRLYRAYGTALASTDAGAATNLLDPAAWTISPRANTSNLTATDLPNSTNPTYTYNGFSEGNPLLSPGNQIINFIKTRYYTPGDDRAAILRQTHYAAQPTLTPATDLVQTPGARLKFTIRRDPLTNDYFALTNHIPTPHYNGANGNPERVRNTIALIRSTDLVHWQITAIPLHDDDTLKHAHQYLDWQIQDTDIIAVSRTATPTPDGGPASQHNSNLLTFHRISNFRNATLQTHSAPGAPIDELLPPDPALANTHYQLALAQYNGTTTTTNTTLLYGDNNLLLYPAATLHPGIPFTQRSHLHATLDTATLALPTLITPAKPSILILSTLQNDLQLPGNTPDTVATALNNFATAFLNQNPSSRLIILSPIPTPENKPHWPAFQQLTAQLQQQFASSSTQPLSSERASDVPQTASLRRGSASPPLASTQPSPAPTPPSTPSDYSLLTSRYSLLDDGGSATIAFLDITTPIIAAHQNPTPLTTPALADNRHLSTHSHQLIATALADILAQYWTETATPITGYYTYNGSTSTWSASSNWKDAIVPNGTAQIADFSTMHTTSNTSRTVNITAPLSLGHLILGDPACSNLAAYHLTGTSTLTFNNLGTPSTLILGPGSALNNPTKIDLPIQLANDLSITLTAPLHSTLNGTITPRANTSNNTITLSHNSTNTGNLTINARLTDNSTTPLALTQNSATSTLTLTANNTHTGDTTILRGHLINNGNLTASAAIVHSGATLSGKNFADITLLENSTLIPTGNSTARNLILDGNSTITLNLANTGTSTPPLLTLRLLNIGTTPDATPLLQITGTSTTLPKLSILGDNNRGLTLLGNTLYLGRLTPAIDPTQLTPDQLLLYALTTTDDPTTTTGNSTHLPTTQITNGTLQLTFTPTRENLLYEVQQSTDLQLWTTIQTLTGNSTSPQPITINSTSNTTTTPQQFLRLKITPTTPL